MTFEQFQIYLDYALLVVGCVLSVVFTLTIDSSLNDAWHAGRSNDDEAYVKASRRFNLCLTAVGFLILLSGYLGGRWALRAH